MGNMVHMQCHVWIRLTEQIEELYKSRAGVRGSKLPRKSEGIHPVYPCSVPRGWTLVGMVRLGNL